MGRDQYHIVGAETQYVLQVHTEAPTTHKAVKNVILQYCCWHQSKKMEPTLLGIVINFPFVL